MNKATILQIAIFAAILIFSLLSTFLSSIKQPKIVVTTPNVVIQTPPAKVIQKTIVIKQKAVPRKSLLTKVKTMFHGK